MSAQEVVWSVCKPEGILTDDECARYMRLLRYERMLAMSE